METIIQQIFTILTTPPGNLIYHLILAFSVASTLQNSLAYWRSAQRASAYRMTTGLVVLMAAQMALFIVSGLSWQGILSSTWLLPPLDRALLAFALVWIVWLWTAPKAVRWVDMLVILMSLIVMIGLMVTLSLWGAGDQSTFNLSMYDYAWQTFTAAAALAGLAILLIKRPQGWAMGVGMLSLTLVGILLHVLLEPAAGHYSGAVRLAQLIAYPLLLVLPQRLVVHSPTAAPTKEKTYAGPERRRYSTDPKTIHTLLQLLLETEASKVPFVLSQAVSQAVLADICLLLSPPDKSGQIVVEGGYDLVREEALPRFELPRTAAPLVLSALQRGRGLRLLSNESSSPDLSALSSALSLGSSGNLLLISLQADGQAQAGALLLLSPYSNRIWSADDQTYLGNISSLLAKLLQRSQSVADENTRRQELEDRIRGSEASRQQVDMLRADMDKLNTELNLLRQQKTAFDAQNQTVLSLTAVQQESVATIDQLKQEIAQLRSTTPTDGAAPADEQLRATLSEMAHLQNSLAQAKTRILELEKRPAASTAGASKNISIIASELRQPLNSLNAQADLLLKVPTDELDPNTRRQIERLKLTVERIRALVSDLINVTSRDKQTRNLPQEKVDLSKVLDLALAQTAPDLSARLITLRVDIPKDLPPLTANARALEQVAVYLLNNACLATPLRGSVQLKVKVAADDPADPWLLLQVVDSGGGIAQTDISRLATAVDLQDPIPGMGNVAGFFPAKAVIEAHGGRLWIDSLPGNYSIFNAILPVR